MGATTQTSSFTWQSNVVDSTAAQLAFQVGGQSVTPWTFCIGERQFADLVASSPLNTADIFRERGFDWGHTAALGGLDIATMPVRAAKDKAAAPGSLVSVTGNSKYRSRVLQAVDYVLGRNAINQSYVTSYGEINSHQQRSWWWYDHEERASLPSLPDGSLAGGGILHIGGPPEEVVKVLP